MARLHVPWSATVTLHTPFLIHLLYSRLFGSHHTATLCSHVSCRLGTDILHTIGLLAFAITHTYFDFHTTTFQSRQSNAFSGNAIIGGILPLSHLTQMTYSYGRQRIRLLCTNYSILANFGTQPWMTAVPLLCTYNSTLYETLAVSRARQRNRLLCTNLSIQCITLAVSLG